MGCVARAWESGDSPYPAADPAVAGPGGGTGELDQARTLARSPTAGMLVLADRNYAAAELVATLAATKADLLIRCKNGRRLPVITRYRDGSWLSTIGTLRVRVIDAQITIKPATAPAPAATG